MTTTKQESKSTKPAKTKLADGSISLTLKLKKEEIAIAYGKVLVESAKYVELKGFRKGKAPLKLVEASLDKSKLYSRVLELVIPPVYSQELKKGKYQPLIEPKITPVKMEEGKDWEFLAETAEAPEVKVGDYRKYIKTALSKVKPKKDLKEGEQDNSRLQAVLEAILTNAEVTPAPVLVEEEAHAQIHKLESQLSQLKLTLADYLKSIKKSEEDFHQEYHQTASDNIRLEFALKSIVEQENPVISDEEIAKHNPKPGQQEYLKYLLKKQKVLDILVEL